MKRHSEQLHDSDVFSRIAGLNSGTLHADIVLALWATAQPTGSSLFVQQFDIYWQQAVLRVYEIHSTLEFRAARRAQVEYAMKRAARSTRTPGAIKSQALSVYDLFGQTHGQLTMGRVTAPGQLHRQFTATYCPGDPWSIPDLCCVPSDNLAGNQRTTATEWKLSSVKILFVGLQRDAGHMTCMDQVAGHFSGFGARKSR